MAILGATGSGKSTFFKRELQRLAPRRLLIWDPMHEYPGQATDRVTDILAAMREPAFSAVFHPSADPKIREVQFSLVCRAALAAGNLTLGVEELRFVTTPGRAPLGWAQVCMTGRHKGLTVYGLTQRPASIDKDFLGNCNRIRCGRLTYPEDVKAVAKAMRLNPAELQRLDGLAPLEFIEVDLNTMKRKWGSLTF